MVYDFVLLRRQDERACGKRSKKVDDWREIGYEEYQRYTSQAIDLHKIRYLSHQVHEDSLFYAQNMSLIPMYSKLCIEDSRCIFSPKRFNGENVYIDPDLPIYFANWMKHLASIVRNFYELDNLWNLNGGKFIISYTEWSYIPSYEREALKMTASHHIEEANKQARQSEADRKREIEQAKDHKSAFTGITMPRFQN